MLSFRKVEARGLRKDSENSVRSAVLDRVSIIVIGLFFVLIPAHAWVSSRFLYYREAFAVVMSGLFLL
jgi:hypothetical protein